MLEIFFLILTLGIPFLFFIALIFGPSEITETVYRADEPRNFSKGSVNKSKKDIIYKKAGFDLPKFKNSFVKSDKYAPEARTIDYTPQYDQTKIDNLIIDLLNLVESPNKGLNGPVRVGGLSGYRVKDRAQVYSKDISNIEYIKSQGDKYTKILVKPYLINLKPKTQNWGIKQQFKKFDTQFSSFTDYRKKIVRPIEMSLINQFSNLFYQHVFKDCFNVTISPADGGKSLWVRVYLEVTTYDFVAHNASKLTKTGKQNIKEISIEVDNFLKKKDISLLHCYNDIYFRSSILLKAENNFRKSKNIPLIGDGWVQQANLRERFSVIYKDTKQEYSPRWLDRKRIDIFIPSLCLAIEYHGLQHYEPVDFFGGVSAFNKRVKDDKEKKDKCEKNKLSFIEWPYTIEINDQNFNIVNNFIIQNKSNQYSVNVVDLI